MRVVHIIPGSGDTFYCENCLRDDGLVRGLRALGHDATVVPLYLPLSTGGQPAGDGAAIFFGGINVYLQQRFGLFRRTPRWIDRLFDSPRLLRWAARKAGMTDPQVLAETTLSMLRGELGRQAKELDRLVDFLRRDPPEVVCLSNALLLGLARRIKRELGSAVVCLLQDEEGFVEDFPDPLRAEAWAELSRRAADVDLFVAVSHYYAQRMRSRLGVPPERMQVVPAGVDVGFFAPAGAAPEVPAVGYLSRMCPEKGLDLLVDAFVMLKADKRFETLKLRVAGGWTAGDVPFIDEVRGTLGGAGLAGEAEFLPNLPAEARRSFLASLSVLSVPTRRPEALGLYILESLACGVPVVQPDHGASAELVGATGGGVLVRPNDPASLAEALEGLLDDPARARALGRAGRQVVEERFTVQSMARGLSEACRLAAGGRGADCRGGSADRQVGTD